MNTIYLLILTYTFSNGLNGLVIEEKASKTTCETQAEFIRAQMDNAQDIKHYRVTCEPGRLLETRGGNSG